MNKKKFVALMLAASIGTANLPSCLVLANELQVDDISQVNLEFKNSSNIETSTFDEILLPEYPVYAQAFKVSGIKSYTTNGGQYASSSIAKAFDGNKSTHWETGKANSSTHTNEIIVTFDEVEAINRVIYAPRQDASYKGFATQFSIYASMSEAGDDFELVGKGKASRTGAYSEFKFESTEFKRLKFVFDEAYNSWASASEFMFFKEDAIQDKVNAIFTDETKTVVSPEFSSVELLRELEEEAKQHPLYSSFKNTIEDAIVILEATEIVAGQAATSVFDYYNNAKYTERFKMSNSNIKSIKTNGGHYSNRVIENAIDEDESTYWETSKGNSASFNNEIVLELNNAVTINRLVFGARQSDLKGFAQEFEIYAAETSSGDNFKLVTTGKHSAVKGLIEAKFEPTKVKRIKLVFKSSTQNWASVNEIACYYEDEQFDKVNGLFTNGLMNEVSAEYNSIEKIAELEKEIKGHPLEAIYQLHIDEAKGILNNQVDASSLKVVTGEQRGAYGKGTANRYINGNAYASFESFGKYVTAGEQITVYVDADANGVLPQLCFGQIGKGQGDWRRWVNLKPGKNIITVPSNINPSAIYLVNNADATQQAYAPRVRIEGGTEFPIYYHGETDPQEFYKELVAYSKNIEYADEAFAEGNASDKVFNIAEFVSENCVITTSAMGAIAGLNAAAAQGYDIGDTMDSWEEMYELFQTFLGLEENASEEKHSYFPNKFVARVFTNVPLGYADHGYTGYLGSNNAERDGGFFKLIAMPIYAKGNDNWCYNHEFGHIFNTKYIVHGEVTNNLFAQEYRRIKGLGGDRADWNGILKRFQGEEVTLGFWTNLAILSQLNIGYGYDAYAKASIAVRDYADEIKKIQGSELRRLAVAYSLGLGVNLLDFFEGWKYTDITPEMEAAVSHLPKETRKIEYLHNGAYDYKGTGFTQDVKVEVSTSVNKEAGTHTLKFDIDESNANDLLGYEVLKAGEVIGYTRNSSFTVKEADMSGNTQYEVVAYAKDLSKAAPVAVNTFAPILETAEAVTLKLGEAFNPLDYAYAVSYDGKVLENVQVTHNVNTAQKGQYEVHYTVTDSGITMNQTMVVTVVSDYDYLSDSQWSSVTTQYSTPRRNSSIKGRLNGQVKTFEKGFGIHANGEIIYQLGEHNYENFEAMVGIDMSIAAQGYSSIQFKVTVDGETLATTRVMKYADNMIYINVPIAGAQELKIEILDGGNGNAYDHAVIVNPRLTSNNRKPVLKVGETFTTVELNGEIDLMAGVSASDAEDGDLTADVTVDEGGLDLSKSGTYTVTYTVTDSDQNVQTVTRKVVVYSTAVYTSDTEWVSAVTDYKAVNKDKNVGGSVLSLNIEGEKESFAKGLGAHANAEIIYDLTDKNYEAFETYIGVDQEISQQANSSIIFKVEADGKEVYNSGLMKWDTPAQFISIDLEGVSELKLIVNNGGNGNTLDHGVFADTKFLVTSSAPQLTVEGDTAVKLGETLDDIYGQYSAVDAEEGDLTNRVTVSGDVDFKQPGKYIITYTVADSDGNETVKERTIAVVDMEDFTYVSDTNWSSASCGWGSIKRDLSPSGNIIRLTDDNGQEVKFEKGLGTHAKSTIVYDLSTVDAEFFSAYVGVDRAMYNTIGSVSFEVYLDDKKVEDTGLMNAKAAMRYIEVNLAGAKELKIIATDGGNGNGSDHAVWGDAKFHFANPENVPADRSELEAYLAELNLLDSSRYTDESWTRFAELKAQVETLIEAEELQQVEINEMLEALKAAEQSLVKVGDKLDLRTFLAQVESLSGHPYTAQSWAVLQNCIEEVKQVLYAIPAQEVIDAASESLQNAVAGLELSPGKMALRAALDSAEEFSEADYALAPMWDEFAELKKAAGEVYYAVTAETEDSLVAMSNKIQEVMSSLRGWQAEQMPQVDKSSLESMLIEANALDLRVYTKDSKEGFAEAAAKAEQFLNNEAVTQEEVDEAAVDLQAALDKLEISNGKAELKKALDLAATKEEADYTNQDYWEMFEFCYDHYLNLYEEDWSEQDLYVAHVYFMTVIEDLERFGR